MTTKLSFNNFRNSDYTSTYNMIYQQLKRLDPTSLEAMNLLEAFNQLVDMREQLFSSLTYSGKNVITPSLKQQHRRRLRAFIAYKHYLKYISYGEDEEMVEAADILIKMTKSYGWSVYGLDRNQTSKLIDNLEVDFKKRKDLAMALIACQAEEVFQKLTEANKIYKRVHLEWTNHHDKIKDIDPAKCRQDFIDLMVSIVKDLEFHIRKATTPEAEELMNHIMLHNKRAQAEVKARKTRRKNRKEVVN